MMFSLQIQARAPVAAVLLMLVAAGVPPAGAFHEPGLGAHPHGTGTSDPGACLGDAWPSDCLPFLPAGPKRIASTVPSDARWTTESTSDEGYTIHVGLFLPSAWSDGTFYLDTLHIRTDGGLSDVDQDGYSDTDEVFCDSNPFNPASTCQDPDADGLVDSDRDGSEEYNGQEVGTAPNDPNSDDDHTGDREELEASGPGAPYDPLDPDSDPWLDRDDDGDGIMNPDDNCPSSPNPYQTDSDRDGVGDPCESLAGPYVPGRGCGVIWDEMVCMYSATVEEFLSLGWAIERCGEQGIEDPCTDPLAYIQEQFSDCHALDAPIGICYEPGLGTGWRIRVGEDVFFI